MDAHPVLPLLPKVKRLTNYFRYTHSLPLDEADDLYQDGCVGALQAVRSYRAAHGTTLASWAGLRIQGALVDGMRTRHLGRRRLPITVERLTARQASQLRAPESPDALEQAEALAHLLAPLGARERQLVLAYYVEGLEMRTIGAQVGLSESGVSRLLTQARNTIRQALTEEA